jgi:magnesium-transporting ATPase (P-type)
MVTLEFVKFVQSWFMSEDILCYDEEHNLPLKCNSSNLNDELGQIHYLFTDKTGTLTKNQMCFKAFTAGEYAYGDLNEDHPNKAYPLVNFYHHDIHKIVQGHFQDLRYQPMLEMLTSMAICHNIIIDPKTNKYSGSSPDELAIIEAGKYFKLYFQGRDSHKHIFINYNGHDLKYELINVLEFDPHRKLMSVIVRELGSNNIFVHYKGADQAIFSRLY